MLTLIFIINTISIFFCLDNFKFVALSIGFSDYISSITYLLTNIAYILSNFFLGYIWNKYNFNVCLFFYVFFFFICVLLNLLSYYWKFAFLIAPQFGRF